MGSYQYAAKLFKENVPVKLMISVEMIGYYSDAPASQTYPVSFLKLLYPSRGNFIGVIGQALDRTGCEKDEAALNRFSRPSRLLHQCTGFYPGHRPI